MQDALFISMRDRLGARKGEWQAIAAKTGISYSWLSKFFNGHIPNPGYRTLSKLRDYLDATAPEADHASA